MTAPRTILDVHILQTVPPSNLNRDDTGSPKSAVFGGTRRSRVSSQCWKRAIRKDFEATLDSAEIGVRTKRLVEMVAEAIMATSPETGIDDALDLASEVLTAAGISNKTPKKPRKTDSGKEVAEAEALAFLSAAQVEALAAYALEAHSIAKIDKKEAGRIADTAHSIDIALFGRMVASDPGLNVDAACQVAHALSTHGVANEFDYYTAVDDRKPAEESSGAGMVGVIEFNSATVYRFATVDVNRLADNLGDTKAAGRAVETFLRSMITSMPSGKQATFGNRTLPDAVVIALRSDQPVSFVGAFEEPVTAVEGRVATSVSRLAAYGTDIIEAYGLPAEQSWVVCRAEFADALPAMGKRLPMPEAIASVAAAVASRLTTE
jgi:CRISPR system Cascade subunit CasC